jgi:hypothetical protein
MQNRRQQAEWEQQALELVRRFQVEQAVGLYCEHDRVVVAETREALLRSTNWPWLSDGAQWSRLQLALGRRNATAPAQITSYRAPQDPVTVSRG